MHDLGAALCLVAVLEGLLLFAAPGAWKRMAERMQAMDDTLLRRVGAAILLMGIVALYLVRAT